MYVYLLRTLTRHRRTSMFFEIWVLWGDARFFASLCVWVSGLVAAWLDFGSFRDRFCVPGVDLCPPGLHFESFVSLWGEPVAPGARHCEKFEKVRTMKRLGSSIGSLLGHILTPLP